MAFQVWSGGHRSGNLDLCDVKTIISSISRGILNAVQERGVDQDPGIGLNSRLRLCAETRISSMF